jgi:hypothetical protein
MISASEIASREHARRNLRKETYKTILEQFSRKIKAASERRESSVTLVVPPFVIGFPMYPFDEALVYLRRQLVISGYSVSQGLEPGQFIVNWQKARPKPAPREVPGVSTAPGDTADDFFASLANLQKTAQQIRAKGK